MSKKDLKYGATHHRSLPDRDRGKMDGMSVNSAFNLLYFKRITCVNLENIVYKDIWSAKSELGVWWVEEQLLGAPRNFTPAEEKSPNRRVASSA